MVREFQDQQERIVILGHILIAKCNNIFLKIYKVKWFNKGLVISLCLTDPHIFQISKKMKNLSSISKTGYSTNTFDHDQGAQRAS